MGTPKGTQRKIKSNNFKYKQRLKKPNQLTPATKRLERANSKGLALFVSAIRSSPQLIALIPSQNLLVCG
ncbi:TPA: hypothetical protein P0E36_003424 [Vibrio harveyi]|nr:hypothetical protein [Vibrio harveyi]